MEIVQPRIQFTKMDKFVKESQIDLVKLCKKIALEVFVKVVEKTPVDTGLARGSWMIGINEIPDDPGYNEDNIRQNPIVETAKLQKTIDADTVITITNHQPYILQLETGTSKKAPSGMIVVSLAEVEAMANV